MRVKTSLKMNVLSVVMISPVLLLTHRSFLTDSNKISWPTLDSVCFQFFPGPLLHRAL